MKLDLQIKDNKIFIKKKIVNQNTGRRSSSKIYCKTCQ